MTSSYLSGGGGGRAYGFDLDNIVKSPSLSTRSSSPSSALSESGNYSSRTISTKRARTPRKRPNQTYTEAAALLSTVYPKVFSTANSLTRIGSHRRFHDSSQLLPTLILDQPLSETPSFNFEPKKPVDSIAKAWQQSPPSNAFQQPGSPGPLADDFDTESILDEEVEDGIDSILGNLSSDANAELTSNRTVHIINPHLRSLMGSGSLAFGLGLRGDIRRALRNADAGDWWSPTVALKDIVPKFQALSSPSAAATAGEKKKKKKKKVVAEEELKESSPSPVSTTTASTTTTSSQQQESLNSTTLLLKLNHDDVLKEWSDRGSPFSPDASGAPESTADILARLADIDLFPEAAGGVGGEREASVMRYKEKRRSRLFSKKIRYQVRKVNADRRPRMKGRFIKRPSLLKEAIEQENL